MIFVTIGTQEPFDRLIKTVDEFAPELNGMPIVAQVFNSTYKARNMKTFDFLTPKEFEDYFQQASLIISHAGMGTIISALTIAKPIVIVPRQVKYHEHRNDHQMATAKRFEALGYVNVVYEEQHLKAKVLEMLQTNGQAKHTIGNVASNNLIDSIRAFISS
ncbi:glycosyltransferase [Adhaeribacter soli]|uniref:Glycosyl transferase family 28 n=1 Tax=Adhaeribacter soli TaxID=2607655 RepID=A0A5N1J2B2_9BACT|nr:glycosyltransferase [Adhaeribacter soli]KAA9340719.1 glycosyl transferase family 28 [Adhaeribacter soli]